MVTEGERNWKNQQQHKKYLSVKKGKQEDMQKCNMIKSKQTSNLKRDYCNFLMLVFSFSVKAFSVQLFMSVATHLFPKQLFQCHFFQLSAKFLFSMSKPYCHFSYFKPNTHTQTHTPAPHPQNPQNYDRRLKVKSTDSEKYWQHKKFTGERHLKIH